MALVHIYFAVRSGSSRLTAANIRTNQILAMPTKLARIRLAFVNLSLAQVPRITLVALTGKRIVPIDADPPVARVRLAIINVRFAAHSRISRGTFAGISGDRVVADSAVPTGLRQTVVDVDLAAHPGKADRARALERIDQIAADSAVETRIRGALVHVDLALRSGETWHANASKRSGIVQAATLVLTGVRLALVDVRLAAWSREALGAVARERTGRVDADAVVLAGRSLIALVDVLGTVDTLVAHRARTRERSVDRAGVTYGVRVARIRGTGVVQMAQQSGLAGRTPAVETTDAVDAGRSVEAGRVDAVVDVVAAVRTVPAVDADAVVAAVGVGTGGTVLADRRLLHALVHIRFAVLAGKARRALAVIGVDPVHTGGTVLAQIARAVVNILLAVFALETGWTFALVVELGRLLASSSVLARRRRTRNVGRFAVLAGISGITHALVRAVRIDALATVQAGILDALLDVLGAGCTLESLRADTLEVAARDGASSAIAAR